MSQLRRHPLYWGQLVLLVVALGTATASAQDNARDESSLRTLKSRSFLLHTDLDEAGAKELLERLETMLGFVAGYWGRPMPGIVEMYVAEDIDQWPAEVVARMEPSGVAAIRSGAGVTIATVMVRGNEFRSKAVVYAVADHGTPQHEAVHAYCDHAFGGTGPVWYAEGMAEVGNYWVKNEKGVTAPPQVIRYLKESRAKALDAIVNNPLESTGDSWQNYAWRWALCHLLGHNENYGPRFKPLGLQLLAEKEVSFWQVYGTQAEEIDFEYRQFLRDMEPGYRVDLCSWDWKTRFTSPAGGRSVVGKIAAGAGWQASRLLVTSETEYEYASTGEWTVGADGEPTDADGQEDGRGRLMGVVFADHVLSEPFELGTFGSFTAPTDGKLYVRCRDSWGSLADNSGTITLRVKVKGSGRALADPRAEAGE